MRTLGSTLKWMFLLLVAATLGGGGYAYYIWTESDELLAGMLRDRLQELAPDWHFDFRHTRFDFQGRIRIRDFSLKSADGNSPLLDVGEIILTVDRERLADPVPVLKSLVFSKVRLHLLRLEDGQWNFQQLTPPRLEKKALPEIHIEQGTIFVDLQSAEAAPERLQLEKFDLRLIPRGARQFLVKTTARLPAAEGIYGEGHWQLDDQTWDFHGQIKSLVLDAALARRVAQLSPDVRTGLTRFDTFLQKLADSQPGQPAPVKKSPAREAEQSDPISRIGFRSVANLQFRLTHNGTAEPDDFRLSLHLLQGVVANPPVPFPLTDLRGQIDFDNQEIRWRELSAQSGQMVLHIPAGHVVAVDDTRTVDFDLTINNLPLDERIPGLLPESGRKIFRDLQPSGEADLMAHVQYDGHGNWTHDCNMNIRSGSAVHRLFPYRVDQIEGQLTRRGNLIEIAVQGRAGMQKVTVNGKVRNPGPEAESRIVIETAGIPVDERLRNACPERFRRLIDQLQAEGDLEGKVVLKRPPGPGQPVALELDARLSDGAINCRQFPYALSGVSGRFHGTGETWWFEEFEGRHGNTEVSFSGDYGRNQAGRLRLLLDFSVTGADLDRKLQEALPPAAQAVWREFNPEGTLQLTGRAYWRPEEEGPGIFQLARCSGELSEGRLLLNSFPFPLNDVSVQLQYDGQTLFLTRFRAHHDDMQMRFDQGTATYSADREWCVRLDKLFVDDLEATPQFRRALPPKLADIVNTLNPRGKQSISGMVEFKGKSGSGFPVTAAWDTETIYSGATVNAGVELREVRGKATFHGTWDGQSATGDGTIRLNSVKIFNKYQLTDVEGPVSMRGSRLILGTEPPEGRYRTQDPAPAHRLSARFIEGLILMDASVVLGDPMRYRVLLTFKDGSLKRYAQLYMNGNNRLAGRMNGNVDLNGEGTSPKNLRGTGNLTISRAALYELPLIAQIFNVLSFVPPDKAAFNNARFAFGIGNGKVRFDRIDLEGDAVNLVGKGTVDFDGTVSLGFASRMGKKTLPIPIVHDVLNMTTQGWVGVDVRGTMQDQKFEVRTLPQVDDAIRRLFDPRMTRR